MPAWTCLPTGASPPVSGSTTPTLTASWATAPADASAPTANATATVRYLRNIGVPLARRIARNLYRSRPAVMARTTRHERLLCRPWAPYSFALYDCRLRHARPCAGHPRLSCCCGKDVDGRDKPGHGEIDSNAFGNITRAPCAADR